MKKVNFKMTFRQDYKPTTVGEREIKRGFEAQIDKVKFVEGSETGVMLHVANVSNTFTGSWFDLHWFNSI